jgi:hypothetical protein
MPPVLRLDMMRDTRELTAVQEAIADRQAHTWPPIDEAGLSTPAEVDRLRRRLVYAAGRASCRLVTRVTFDRGTYRVMFIVKKETL